MKRKSYWRFALPRVIAALLIGAIIYSITIFAFATRYNNLIIAPFIAGPVIFILFIWFMFSSAGTTRNKDKIRESIKKAREENSSDNK